MGFRFYIWDCYEGAYFGTDDAQLAEDYAACCDYYVVDTETNRQFLEDGTSSDVKDIAAPTIEDELG